MIKMTMLLKSSEVMPVRRAVFAAGAQRVVVDASAKREETISLADWYRRKEPSAEDVPVRLEVLVDTQHTHDVISAFMRTAQVGKIERISRQIPQKEMAFAPMLRAA